MRPAGVIEAGAGQAEVRAALVGRQAFQEPGVVLNVQLVEDEVLRCDRGMAGREVGGLVMDDALAAAGIDRGRDVDERGGREQFGETHVLRQVGVRVAKSVMRVEQVAVAIRRRDDTGPAT